MSFLLLLPILFPIGPTQGPPVDNNTPIAVVSFKWFKDRRLVEDSDLDPLVTDASPDPVQRKRDWERNRRIQDPTGARDPNVGSIEQRSAALGRIAKVANETNTLPIKGFTYQVRIQNNSTKLVKTVFWEVQFTEKANPQNVSHRQFVCSKKMKPEKRGNLEIFTPALPTNVISLETLKKGVSEAFDETVIINRVEYEGGSVWQRKGWNFDEVKLTVRPADSRKIEPCQGL